MAELKAKTMPSWVVTGTLAVAGWMGLMVVQVMVSFYILEGHIKDFERSVERRLTNTEQTTDALDERVDTVTGRVIKLEAVLPEIRKEVAAIHTEVKEIKRMIFQPQYAKKEGG